MDVVFIAGVRVVMASLTVYPQAVLTEGVTLVAALVTGRLGLILLLILGLKQNETLPDTVPAGNLITRGVEAQEVSATVPAELPLAGATDVARQAL